MRARAASRSSSCACMGAVHDYLRLSVRTLFEARNSSGFFPFGLLGRWLRYRGLRSWHRAVLSCGIRSYLGWSSESISGTLNSQTRKLPRLEWQQLLQVVQQQEGQVEDSGSGGSAAALQPKGCMKQSKCLCRSLNYTAQIMQASGCCRDCQGLLVSLR